MTFLMVLEVALQGISRVAFCNSERVRLSAISDVGSLKRITGTQSVVAE